MAVLMSIGTLAPGSGSQGGERPLRVVTVAGRAELQKTTVASWSAATLSAELEPGDAARTLAGRLTLRTASGQAVRLASSSRVALLDAALPDQPTRVRLDAGSVWAAVMKESPPGQQLEFQTSAVTVTVRGSGVGITLNRDGSVLVRVYHGGAECAGPGTERRWIRTLADEQELSVSGERAPEVRKLQRDKLDVAWVKWNEEQDLAGGYGGKPPAR